VRIPRCRATVSEEICSRSLGHSWEGRLWWLSSKNSDSRSQETGANRPLKPFSRVKGGVRAVLLSFRLLYVAAIVRLRG
jgi:hypothetical protein